MTALQQLRKEQLLLSLKLPTSDKKEILDKISGTYINRKIQELKEKKNKTSNNSNK